jgi:hydroxymethylpyrimidine/phosphomethylpyrimidine kinase
MIVTQVLLPGCTPASAYMPAAAQAFAQATHACNGCVHAKYDLARCTMKNTKGNSCSTASAVTSQHQHLADQKEYATHMPA